MTNLFGASFAVFCVALLILVMKAGAVREVLLSGMSGRRDGKKTYCPDWLASLLFVVEAQF